MFDLEKFAGQLYETYCSAVGGKAFNGSPLPNWKEFSSDPSKEKQYRAWIETAQKAHDVMHEFETRGK